MANLIQTCKTNDSHNIEETVPTIFDNTLWTNSGRAVRKSAKHKLLLTCFLNSLKILISIYLKKRPRCSRGRAFRSFLKEPGGGENLEGGRGPECHCQGAFGFYSGSTQIHVPCSLIVHKWNIDSSPPHPRNWLTSWFIPSRIWTYHQKIFGAILSNFEASYTPKT